MNTQTVPTLEVIEQEFRTALEDATLDATRQGGGEDDDGKGGWVNIRGDIKLPCGVTILTGWWIHVDERDGRGNWQTFNATPYPQSSCDDGCEYTVTAEMDEDDRTELEEAIERMVGEVLEERASVALTCYMDEVLRPLVERRVAKARSEQDEAIENATDWDELVEAAKAAGVAVRS